MTPDPRPVVRSLPSSAIYWGLTGHTTVGHQIAGDSDSNLLRMAAKTAVTYRQRWDGNGYPLGLSGEGILQEGRGSQFDPQIVDALLNYLDEALRLRSVHP